MLANAAPLCASCHDLYGGNPEKRRQMREMRDHWWAQMEVRARALTIAEDLAEPATIAANHAVKPFSNAVAIYHVVFSHEGFEESAKILAKLVASAEKQAPRRPRWLYLDIEGHRNASGGFDHDMFELQTHFLLGCMGRYLKRISMPLITIENRKPQRNDVPEEFRIVGLRPLNMCSTRLTPAPRSTSAILASGLPFRSKTGHSLARPCITLKTRERSGGSVGMRSSCCRGSEEQRAWFQGVM